MRHMPIETPDGKIPALPADEWARLVAALIGRPTTEVENDRIEKMARHNWTVRVVAEDIVGRDLTEEEVANARRTAGLPAPQYPYPKKEA